MSLCSPVAAFDPPSMDDPWYYQTYERGLEFAVPDKAQHYWGSYGLSEVFGPYAALGLGILWEIKDDKLQGVGFSYKDLIADGLGVISSRINKDNKIRMWLDYSVAKQEITLRAAMVF